MVSTLGVVGNAAVGSFPVGGSGDPLVPGIFIILGGINLVATNRLQDASLEMQENVGGTKTLDFLHQIAAGGVHLEVGKRILLRQETVNIFLGTLDRIDEEKVPGSEALFTRVEAVDLGSIFDRRLLTVDNTYTSQLSGAIVRDLINTYASGEGFTLNSVQDGSNVDTFSVRAFKSVAKTLRDLSERTGLIFFVDANGDLHWESQTQVLAPFAIPELLDSGTAQAGSANTLTLAADAPTSLPGDSDVRLVSGPGSVQERPTSSYDGLTKVATVSPNWNAQYLDLPGTSDNYASTPDSAAVSITGDIDIRVKAQLVDWSTTAVKVFTAKNGASGNRSFYFHTFEDGLLFDWYANGVDFNRLQSDSLAGVIADNAIAWVRVTLDVDNGADGRTGRFYTSTDGETWVQLGSDITSVGVTSIFDGTAPFELGGRASDGVGQWLDGKIYYAELRNGIDGPVVAKFDPLNDGGKIGDTSFTSSTGEVWTINQSGSPAAKLDGPPDATTGYKVVRMQALDEVRVEESREKYRNRQTVRYGSDLALSVTENDLTEQAARKVIESGTGIHHAAEDAKDIVSASEATALAQALLRRFAIPTSVKLSLRQRGLKAGQTVTLDLPQLGVTGNFFIDKLSLRDIGRGELIYSITALSGEHQGDVMDAWRAAFGSVDG